LFGIGALQRAGIGAHRGVYPDLPRQHLLPPGGIPFPAAPRMTTRTIVRLPDRTGHGPAFPARRPAWIKKFILGVDIIYSLG
jgi:hypothetical protein